MYKQHNGLQHVLLTCRSTSLFGSRPPNHPASHADAARPFSTPGLAFGGTKLLIFGSSELLVLDVGFGLEVASAVALQETRC